MKKSFIYRLLIVPVLSILLLQDVYPIQAASGNTGSSSSKKKDDVPHNISKKRAQRIALKDAGVSADEVESLRSRRRDRGRTTEVSFYRGTPDGRYVNYLYYIKSLSGEIKSKSSNNVNVISKDAALHIAMATATIPQENYLSGTDIRLDDSSGVLRYHITFHGPSFVNYDDQVYSARKFRYDFIIDAATGAVLTWDAFDG